jgi:hypothetical protein
MENRIVRLTMLALVVVLGGCASRARQAEPELKLPAQRFELAGDTVQLFDLAGEVRIERGDGNLTVVEVTRFGVDAQRVSVDTGRIGGEQTLRVRFPGERVTTNLRPRGSVRLSVADDGRFGAGVSGVSTEVGRGGGGVRAHANIVVRVPAGRTLILHLGVGKIVVAKGDANLRLTASAADVTADSSRGSLNVDLAEGTVKVATFTGPVSVRSDKGDLTLSQIDGDRLEIRSDTGSVSGSGVDARRLDVRTTSAPVILTGVRSAITHVVTERARTGVSIAGDVDSVRIESDSADVTLSLVGALRSLAARSLSGNIAIRVSPAVSASVLLEGELRAPTVELTLGSAERSRDVPCAAPPRDGVAASASCNVVRGTLGSGEGRIFARSQRGDVRLAGF